nr:respiratory nitrate reductase subunit gamma [Kineosphaera limosa]
MLWVIIPYMCLISFVVGHFWRYKYDKFGWTTRSSQMYESRLLQIGSPLFHFGLLFVIGGHVIGLVIPKSWTEAIGISQEAYHWMAVVVGAIAGFCTVAGMIILIYRRRTTGPVFAATTVNDKIMYVFLAGTILLGLSNTIIGNVLGHYDYREGVSVWWRQFFLLHPDPSLMADAPLTFQLHTLFACLLFAIWPFTRLVHVFSAPLQYLWRPYVVYRSKTSGRLGARESRRGWERSELTRK